ncbi:inter-alpha-trypsin inhibitor heavy chain H4-like isoform X1 [Lethenteron reissneri]|uniref:inter-alpha-trypsin inhibitor heavy chain H4-like isoform X1 n=1 Tax=Lethenteron reissneri TaxID=7753 RepID=UPI002AB7BAD8|nr:inter-alpha-trypsin inhibitor heavy chain H4-like isoform X1 [Lethenteron reissneri]
MARLRLLGLCLVLALPTWTGAGPVDGNEDATPKITEMSIVSRITSRYAHTTINSWLLNTASRGKEVTFHVQLPEAAFISAFSMTVRNKTYPGVVKEKEQAKQVYSAAVDRGWSAGLVATRERETDKFTVSVNVGAGSRALFTLSYEELLQRKLEWYEHVVSVRPQQTVDNLTVEVSIEEKAGLSRITVPPLRTSNLITNDVGVDAKPPPATSIVRTATSVVVRFQPSVEQQLALAEDGVLGDFIVRYDVERTEEAGELEIVNGYFAHFFAPKRLSALPKSIVFVIDVSGSMDGTKIKQTKEAMLKILGDLRPKDHFNIVTFSYGVKNWVSRGLVKASAENIEGAKKFVSAMVADGGTNIKDALSEAVSLLKYQEVSKEMSVPLIILLTDGQPTVGETNVEVIIKNARSVIAGLYSLYCLGFGQDVEFNFLEKLALPNSGFARKIFEDVDATLQLKGFYDEVGTPLLSNVVVRYTGNEVAALTRSTFPNYFSGSEIVVAGRVRGDTGSLVATVEGLSESGPTSLAVECVVPPWPRPFPPRPFPPRPLPPTAGPPEPPSHTERLWAFLTIKQLLKEKVSATDDATKGRLDNETLALSLRYGFVTPLTSMVVTVPDDGEQDKGGDEPKPKKTLEVEAEGAAATADDVVDRPVAPAHNTKLLLPARGGSSKHVGRQSGRWLSGSGHIASHPGSSRSRVHSPPTSHNIGYGSFGQRGPPGPQLFSVPGGASPPMLSPGLPSFDTIDDAVEMDEMQATMVPSFTTSSRGSITAEHPPTVLHLPSKDITLCFSSHGSDRQTIVLLEDTQSGVSVSAKVGTKGRGSWHGYAEVNIQVPTVQGSLKIRVTATHLHLNLPHSLSVSLQTNSNYQIDNVTVRVERGKAVVVSVAGGVEIVVSTHGTQRRHQLALAVLNPRGLSPATTGLLGVLLHQDVMVLPPPDTTAYPGLSPHLAPSISIGSRTLSVLRKDLEPVTSGSPSECLQTDFALLGA